MYIRLCVSGSVREMARNGWARGRQAEAIEEKQVGYQYNINHQTYVCLVCKVLGGSRSLRSHCLESPKAFLQSLLKLSL